MKPTEICFDGELILLSKREGLLSGKITNKSQNAYTRISARRVVSNGVELQIISSNSVDLQPGESANFDAQVVLPAKVLFDLAQVGVAADTTIEFDACVPLTQAGYDRLPEWV